MDERIYTYRDARLRSQPLRLLNWLGAGAAAVGLHYPPLTAAAVITAARQRTGLADLGDDSVREALRHYLDSVEREAQLTLLGRFAVHNMLVNALANRLQIIDWLRQHPEAADERIEQPWVVLGLPRTGTSLLSILLGLDPRCRPLRQWEAARPMPPPDLASAAEDTRIGAFTRDMERALRLNPTLGAMHPFGSTLAEECTALFMFALRSVGLEAISFAPSYGRWLDHADMAPALAMHKQVLQALQSTQPTERWVLKSPQYLWCPDALVAAYPDARILWTHRDPADVVTSLASINNAMQLTFTQRSDPKPVADYWANRVSGGIARASAFDESRAPGWCRHVQYQELIGDPLATVERIYEHFGDSVSELHRRRMQTWLRHRPQNVFGKHQYDPADFGWNAPDLTRRFQDYRERYAIRG